MKIIAGFICLLIGTLLLRASYDFPDWADPQSPASSHVSSYYLENSLKDSEVPNVVSAVLADYRSMDTMWETSVVLIAAIAIIFLIRRSSYEEDYRGKHKGEVPRENLIIATTVKLTIPIIVLFAFYVLIHGHHSPGGGFQGGVILGATLILHSLAFGLQETMKFWTEVRLRFYSYLGVIIFFAVGVSCLFLGYNFLEYAAFSEIFPVSIPWARSLSILVVELGIALTVMAVMFSIYADLSSAGDLDKGL